MKNAIKSAKMKISKNQKMCFFSCPKDQSTQKIRFLRQKVCPVARGRTDRQTDTHTHTHTHKKEVTRTIVWTVHLYDRNKSVFKLSMKVGFFHIGSHKGWVLLCSPINSYSWQRVCVGSRSGHTIYRGWFHQSYKSLCPINIRSMLTSSLRLDFSQSSLAYYYHVDKKIISDI